MSEAILFRKCLGYNDSQAISSQTCITDPRSPDAGKTELIAVSNMTTTSDGCIQTVPALSTVVTHSAPITRISAGTRLIFGDATNTNEWTGSAVVQRFPAQTGPICHTSLDARVCGASKVYKSADPTGTMAEATVGTSHNPDTTITYSAMPRFTSAFDWNGYLCAVNASDARILQYSDRWKLDLWNPETGFRVFPAAILQAGAIPGVLLTTHTYGVTVCTGQSPVDPQLGRKFHSLPVINGTLFSGLVSKNIGFGHVFMAADGVYMAGMDGTVVNLTAQATDRLDALNTSYSGAIVHDGKYLAFGNTLTVEYDFQTKAVMLRRGGLAGGTIWHNIPYLASGSTLCNFSTSPDKINGCSFQLPYSYLGAEGRKSFDSVYFTGEITDGSLDVIAYDQTNPADPECWRVTVNDPGVVQNYRVKLPKGTIGSKVSFGFAMAAGYLRVEEMRVVFAAGNRR